VYIDGACVELQMQMSHVVCVTHEVTCN